MHPPDGRVTISSPEHIALDKLKVYLLTKLQWIRKERKKIITQPRETEKLYITRESHYLFGKRYLLKITYSVKGTKVLLHHSTIEILLPKPFDAIAKQKALHKWYRQQLALKLDALVDKWRRIIGVNPSGYTIRTMKTKWGSCSDKSGRLNFNLELVKKPIECIEYIVVHELMHFLRRHHDKDFIALMNQYLPNWQLRKKNLNELPV